MLLTLIAGAPGVAGFDEPAHSTDVSFGLSPMGCYGYCSSNLVEAPVASTISTTALTVRGINWLESPTTVLASVAPSAAVLKLPDDLVKLV